ncbi:MAG TPA: hypothetical protein VG963_11845, partial [Polyangiaceae bacterium]|nr:hypothetical protein [Polyangiaceae bacterium]
GHKAALVASAGQITKGMSPEVSAAGPPSSAQLEQLLAWLGQLSLETAYAFHVGRDLLPQQVSHVIDPLRSIWCSIEQQQEPHPRQAVLLSELDGKKLRLHGAAATERFGFNAADQIVVNALRTRPRALDELLQAGLAEPERVRRLIYTLMLTRHLDVGSERAPLDSVPPPPSVRARELDRAPVSVAPISRADTVRCPQKTSPSAEAAYQAALGRIGRKQFDAAEALARAASEAEPSNAEYLALHAWVRAQLGQLSDPRAVAQIVAALDRAVHQQRDSSVLRLYRAQVLKRLGRDEDAYKDFCFILRREPRHLDAAREVRLYRLRRRNAGKKLGVFSKLFLR